MFQFLLIGTIGMLLLCGGVVTFFFLYQRRVIKNKLHLSELESRYKEDLLFKTIEQVESERKRIAIDLHDEIGSIFTTLDMKLQQISRIVNNTESDEVCKQSRVLTEKGIKSARNISYDLMPPELEMLGLAASLQNLCKRVEDNKSIQVKLDVRGFVKEPEHSIALALYRIMQELISNTLHHAGASLISITFATIGNAIHVEYRDNGKGFDWKTGISRKGLGLRGLENRVNMIKGKHSIQSAPGEGMQVAVEVPYI